LIESFLKKLLFSSGATVVRSLIVELNYIQHTWRKLAKKKVIPASENEI